MTAWLLTPTRGYQRIMAPSSPKTFALEQIEQLPPADGREAMALATQFFNAMVAAAENGYVVDESPGAAPHDDEAAASAFVAALQADFACEPIPLPEGLIPAGALPGGEPLPEIWRIAAPPVVSPYLPTGFVWVGPSGSGQRILGLALQARRELFARWLEESEAGENDDDDDDLGLYEYAADTLEQLAAVAHEQDPLAEAAEKACFDLLVGWEKALELAPWPDGPCWAAVEAMIETLREDDEDEQKEQRKMVEARADAPPPEEGGGDETD